MPVRGNLRRQIKHAELVREHPESPLSLEASIGMGFVSAQMRIEPDYLIAVTDQHLPKGWWGRACDD